jgi:hypothetical protein
VSGRCDLFYIILEFAGWSEQNHRKLEDSFLFPRVKTGNVADMQWKCVYNHAVIVGQVKLLCILKITVADRKTWEFQLCMRLPAVLLLCCPAVE